MGVGALSALLIRSCPFRPFCRMSYTNFCVFVVVSFTIACALAVSVICVCHVATLHRLPRDLNAFYVTRLQRYVGPAPQWVVS